ncbi:MAG: alkaline phosphatase family protein [Pirellulales bacterium]
MGNDGLLPVAFMGLWAYIGPGAGIALVGSFLAVISAIFTAVLVMLTWPLRRLWYAVRGQRARKAAKTKRVVILGLDGLEPTLAEQFLSEGLLPNLAKLRAQGGYQRMTTTWPPLSPVAWSSFATGSNPGKHNIYDFISRDPHSYQPTMSSVRIREPKRSLKLGKWVIPLSKPEITGLRKSKPFWNLLGESNIFSAVLRVPITFPPDKFSGIQLAAMCVPDLLGTQGTFSYYCNEGTEGATHDSDAGGQRILVRHVGGRWQSHLKGPANSLRVEQTELQLPFTVTPGRGGRPATLSIGRETVSLPMGEYTPWVKVAFAAAPGFKVHGICRFYLKRLDSKFEMYCSSIQIDPDKPVMPIAHPTIYSSYLARQQGPFATLGLAEDTWSLSEGLMDEDAFLKQAYDIHQERETMFFDAIRKVRRGMVVCVFDGPDRIQHMFWRFMDKGHPALEGRQNTHADSIRSMYVRMDELVGRTMRQVGDDTTLIVMSDHGFTSFQRGVDLNAWLRDHGYLFLKNEAWSSNRIYLHDVDWTRTRAYAIGLAGIFVNQTGRESQGIVEPGRARQELVEEIASKLTGLRDPKSDGIAVHEAVPRERVYQGPYTQAAPDIIVGYSKGFRVSWDAAVGKTGPEVFTDNRKAWSGDHCVHPELVPGVLFTSIKLNTDKPARIIDIAPTTLELLGVERPAYMDGVSLV